MKSILTLTLAFAALPLEAQTATPSTLARRVAADAGSPQAPLLVCIGMHIEPFGATPSKLAVPGNAPVARQQPSYRNPQFFQRQTDDIRLVASIAEKYGGRLTLQAQTPFTQVAAQSGEHVLAELETKGHEVALHFHEEAHLGRNGGQLDVPTWTAVMKEEIDWLHQAGVKQVRYWSGGNLYPGVLAAAAGAGLSVMSDYKNPHLQASDPSLLAVHPWRPAGGPSEGDLAAFARHDPQGGIVYLPDGLFSRTDHAGMRRSAETGGDWKYFDFLTEGLEASLRAARPDRINVFHVTVHAGEFRGDRAAPFAVIDAWLRDVVSPLVKAGRVKWATFSQMADAYQTWEQAHPGVNPRGTVPTAAVPQPDPPNANKGSINFVVNVHDWVFADDSAATVARLVDIFRKHGVRGEFYLTAPVVEAYQEKHPEVIAKLKDSGMTISYHVRPPHPLWRGFSQPLAGKEGTALADLLRDYETYRLDLATGQLDRSKAGGYRYVEQVFGVKPVAVGASDAPPAVRATGARVYASLGAQVGVFYHESGTKIDQPFEFRDGLLVRPSDFSITRATGQGEAQGPFWWAMVGTPREAEFDPVIWLKDRLAAWQAPRPPFVTSLIHESDFYRQNGPGWNAIYFAGQAPKSSPRQSPWDLQTPPTGGPRRAEVREAIFRKYDELVTAAVATLQVATSAEIAAQAKPPKAVEPNDRVMPNRPIQNQRGPWNNDVLVYRVPADGKPEKLATFGRAGVPTVGRLQDGRLAAAFQHFPEHDERNFDRVAVCFSKDEGRTWSAPEPIVVEGMDEGLMRPFDPTIVPLPDGKVRLYFTSNRNRDPSRGVPAIYSAISADAIHYTFEPGVRFAVENRIVIDCAAALHQGVFHLIVPNNGTAADFPQPENPGTPPPAGQGHHAISRDGLKFDRVDDVMIPNHGRWLGNLQSDGGRLLFFGTGGGGPGQAGGVWRGSSADGKVWQVEAATMAVPGADPGAVRLRDGSWLVVVTGPPRPGATEVP